MTKEELEKYNYINRKFESIEKQRERIKSQIMSATGQQINDISSCTKTDFDKIGQALEKIESLNNKLIKKLLELCEEQLKIEEAIENASDILTDKEELLIRFKYLNCLKENKICAKLRVGPRRLYDIQKSALEKI